jgi:hypothetical protein
MTAGPIPIKQKPAKRIMDYGGYRFRTWVARRRNSQCMVLTEGEAAPISAAQHLEDTNGANRTLIEAIAKGHRWQAQLEPACRQAGPASTRACPEQRRGASKTWPRTSARRDEAERRRAATAPTSAGCYV